MLFNKKRKQMVDIRELQKRGVVRIPKKDIVVPINNEGFVELEQTKDQGPRTKDQTNTDFFGFTSPTSIPSEPTSFPTESNGYNKREVDQKVTDLDNKIYKLEQRIELLEKKLDINQPENNIGAMGW